MATTTLKSRTADTFSTTRGVARKTALAYVGLNVAAYQGVKSGISRVRASRKAFFESLVTKGEDVETAGLELFGKAKAEVSETAADAGKAIKDAGKTVKNALPKTYTPKSKLETLETEKAALEKKLKTMPKKAKVKAKTTVKKAKAAVKAAPAKAKKTTKAAAPKTAAPKAASPAVDAETKTKAPAAHIAYWEDAQRYDANVTEANIKAIVAHLGIALQSQDGTYVACSDDKERDTVRDSWLIKKLGVTGTPEALDAKVVSICEMMKDDHMKKRPTFYYLLAKQEGKLSVL
ncbi:DUF2853 family protein [Robiginitomaculum antarcticum]|uniref:DUF2853 family protein n=1 Tax=Robiginitomaculum antarcticum TaxID=437507 RepID=UPI0003642C73|nr:DUF2853 family protein [Robiginitomaculum antarcticum]